MNPPKAFTDIPPKRYRHPAEKLKGFQDKCFRAMQLALSSGMFGGDIVTKLMSTTAMPRERLAAPAERIAALEANIARVLRGKPAAIRHAAIALLARGHLLIEDVPGVGKTTLARALARSIGGTFHRLQFTSDLLPSDVVGVSILDPKSGEFEFRPGPVFANLVLADEINRTPPRTQSALLEAMNEGQVSVDGRTYPLEAPFLVMATQNAEERYGTYPLPESQMDRFLLRIRIDYPSPEDERRILLESAGRPEDALARLDPVLSVAEVRALQEAAERVHLSVELADYIVAVARETRRSPHLSLGVSPRGQLAWRNAARAAALAEGRDYVLPDDLRSLAGPVLAHRIVPASPVEALTRARSDVERILADIIDRLPAPG
jgi:MoxR-like ATPase